MFTIEFYEKENGESDVGEFLEDLRARMQKSKDARIQYKQTVRYLELLELNGTRLPENVTKHIDEDIWELRPGDNRIFYFCKMGDTFVMLHHFRKKTQKTPAREIEQAKRERDDYIRRNKGEQQ